MPTACICCATARGLKVASELRNLLPAHYNLLIVSFREGDDEPPFFDSIASFAASKDNNKLIEGRYLGQEKYVQMFDEIVDFEFMLVVSWRYMIPKRVYELPTKGTYVYHDAPLPIYRGFAPTVWAIINGESSFGVTLMCIGEDVDSGNIVMQESYGISPDNTITEIMPVVTNIYISILRKALPSIMEGSAATSSLPQDHNLATYTCKRVPERDNLIHWTDSRINTYNKIRGLSHPYQGAFCFLDGRRIKIWSARLPAEIRYVSHAPGRVLKFTAGKSAFILCGDGLSIELISAQSDDGMEEPAGNILNKLSITLTSQ